MSKPALPGESIRTSVWSDGRGAYVFETSGDEKPGKFVLTDGLAEFA
jgi:hypothetical protein